MKRKKAIALKYDKGYKAPIVTALGAGKIAEAIINLASENKIPIVENNDLTESLSKLNLGDTIPQELYEAVAEIIAYIHRISSKIEDF